MEVFISPTVYAKGSMRLAYRMKACPSGDPSHGPHRPIAPSKKPRTLSAFIVSDIRLFVLAGTRIPPPPSCMNSDRFILQSGFLNTILTGLTSPVELKVLRTPPPPPPSPQIPGEARGRQEFIAKKFIREEDDDNERSPFRVFFSATTQDDVRV